MEPERPIEKQLREFAKKRRDDAGAPLEPHPATRRMLQGEVARQFPKRAAGGTAFGQVLANWRPRLAWALPMLVVLGVAMWVLVPSQRKPAKVGELAKNAPMSATRAPEELKRREPAAPPATPPVMDRKSDHLTVASADGDRTKAEDKAILPAAETLNLGEQPALASAPPTPAEPAAPTAALQTTNQIAPVIIAANEAPVPRGGGGGIGGAGFGGGGGGGGRGGGRGGRVAGGAPALAGSAPSGPSAVTPAVGAQGAVAQLNRATSGGAGAAASSQMQMFSPAEGQTSLSARFRNAAAPAVSNQVLADFRVEQTGNQLRVIDNDNSIYTGDIEMAADNNNSGDVTGQMAPPKMESAIAARQIAAAPASNAQAAQNFSFRVAGTNRTLNQQVVFTGNFASLANAPVALQQLAASQANSQNYSNSQQQSPPLLQNSFINGRAQVGAGQPIEINAVPAAP
jgi:hypothetical protein